METRTSSVAWRSLVIVTLVWAVIYLPALGWPEIKGEEGRRILPAWQMLETGNYVVPHIGSEPYLNKPPLMNWLIAASFHLLGQRTEFAARLPSTLAVLAVALAFVWRRSLVAALIWLTCLGVVDKGRLAEIEALYISLTALAFIFWLTAWREGRSPWRLWLVPAFFLGLGLLAKGPPHLVFFYGVVVAVLWKEGKLRQLCSLPHAAGIVLMVAIFGAWAGPYLMEIESGRVAAVWSRQLGQRIVGETFHLADWVWNIPEGLWLFLPWALLLPLVRLGRVADEPTRLLLQGMAWGLGLSFVVVSLLPAVVSRYIMPLLGAAVWFLALALEQGAVMGLSRPLRWSGAAVAIVCLGSIFYFQAPRWRERGPVRTMGARINELVAPPARLYAINPGFQPSLFYVRAPVVYLRAREPLPPEGRFVLLSLRGKKKQARVSEAMKGRDARLLLETGDGRGHNAAVYEINPAPAP